MKHAFLIGHPVGHSKSPAVHRAVFDAMGLDWAFDLADIAESDKASSFLEAGEFVGLSVTTPYKPLAARKVDICAASARLAGGANVVANRRGVLLGANADGRGAVSFMQQHGVDFEGTTVAVCGTGPTALSCLHAAAQAGADCVILFSRDKERARKTVQDYLDLYRDIAYASINPPGENGGRSFRGALEQVKYLFGAYDSSEAALEAADVVIDATILGMKEGDPAPFDTAVLHADQAVFDVCYMRITALLQAAKDAGCTCFDGSAMLLGQAVIAQDMWFEAQEVDCPLSWDERIALMAAAAGFAG